MQRRPSPVKSGSTTDTRTFVRNPAYPPRIRPWCSGRTASRISPQNRAVARLPLPTFRSGDVSSAKWSVDVPPMSASHPVATSWMPSCVWSFRSVMGVRLGGFAPSMRRTASVSRGVNYCMAYEVKWDVLLTAPSARYFVDLFRYALRCEMAMSRLRGPVSRVES